MTGRAFLDTNVLVYLFDADSAAKQEMARRLMRDAGTEGRLALSTQVLQELYVTLTRKLAVPLTEADAERVIQDLSALPLVQVDVSIVLAAIATSRQDRIAFWDALIVEAARSGGCDRLLSEDFQTGRRFGDIVVENPFA